ncbi:hypothetical protein ABXT21_06130 [Ralstonia sp. SM1864_UCD524_TZ4]|uniref:hypothetical protein n=1 Tax=Ralstonia solanacearum species complex TaxID=3116862 RepID=UPI0018D0445A|nr:hypothetical protein [Ralstonia pseudosolanacearum]
MQYQRDTEGISRNICFTCHETWQKIYPRVGKKYNTTNQGRQSRVRYRGAGLIHDANLSARNQLFTASLFPGKVNSFQTPANMSARVVIHEDLQISLEGRSCHSGSLEEAPDSRHVLTLNLRDQAPLLLASLHGKQP